MKRKITLLCLLAFLCLIPHVSGQCTFGTKNPSYAHNPVYDQNEYLIMEDAHPGEYMMINTFSTATIYKFRSSQPTDYITITDAAGAQIFASGLNGSGGLNFTPPYPQPVRFYIHANAQCESNPFSTRTRFLKTTTVTYPCDSPHSLTVSNITSNSSKISWNAPIIGQNSSFEVYANTTGIAPVENTNPSAVAAGSTNAQLSGLTAGAAHYYWVRSFCTANSGVWVPGGTFNTLPAASCNGAPYGLYPEEMVQVPCNGMMQQITDTAYAGEYSNVQISSGSQYTFSSSVATDFITITDPTGATVYTSGQSPLVWINNSNWGSIRYYLHSDSSCGSLMANRIKYIKCGGDVSGGCTDGDLHPSATFTPACTGSLELVSNNSWGGEYSNINVAANKQYTFSTSVSSDYVTIVNPTGNTVLATGPSPLTWTSGTTAMTIEYYLHTNVNCGTQNIDRQRYIKCSDPAPSCGVPLNLAVSNITSNSCRLSWTAPASTPGSGYEIYMVTNNTAPGVNTAATLTSTTAGSDVINGLTAGMTYYYWIRSNCGSQKSSWVSGGSFTVNPSLTCNGAIYGLYPNATFTPACTGNAETISADCWAGEYTNVNVTANKQFTFSSSVSTDYITITNTAGTTVLASGQSPLSWNSGTTTGIVRYHLNSNANCGAQNTSRTRYIQCSSTPAACGLPSALSVSNITSNSSRINWTAPAPAPISYDLYIVTTNNAPTTNTAATVTSNTANIGVLSGLTSSTTYYYWIRSNCGAAKSAWVSGGSFATIAALTCNGASVGLYPEATFTPACTGSNEQIVADAYAGEFSNVNVVANKQYTFTSSVTSDYITITNATGTSVYASGTTPLNWSSGSTSGMVRYHINTNANCGTQNAARIRSVKCVDAVTCTTPASFTHTNITSNSVRLQWSALSPAPVGIEIYVASPNTPPVDNTNATVTTVGTSTRISVQSGLTASTNYNWWLRTNCGSSTSGWVLGGNFTTLATLACNGATYGMYPNTIFTAACTGSNEVIAENAYAGEFAHVMSAENKQYTFSSSVSSDYITITNFSGTVVFAHGMTPLNWSSGNIQGLVRYYIHSNANCGSQNTDRIRWIKCADTVPASCDAPTQLTVSNITSDSCRMTWVDPANAPSGFELYVSTSNTAPASNSNPNGWAMSSGINYYAPLEPGTTYHYWVRSACGDMRSTWASGGSFTTLQELQCNGAIFGLYPEDTIILDNTGALEPVAYQAMAGQYSNVYVASNKQYVLTSSIATDRITVTNATGSTVLASGTTPLTWNSGNTSGTVRFYLHANADCNPDDFPRDKFMKVTTLGMDDHLAGNLVRMYPNPSNGQFTVDSGNITPDNIVIFDNLGRIISTHKASAAKTTVSIDALSDGIYYVTLNYQDQSYTEKLILKRR